MKRIQKGFTLIELMIVVAIIGILAAVAIPAYQDYVVKSKLTKVTSTLDPIKTAIAMYFQENGGFPNVTDALTNGTLGSPSTGTLWNSLGFSTFPTLPAELQGVYYSPAGAPPPANATTFALNLVMSNIKAGFIDGQTVSISPTSGTSPTATNTDAFPATTITGSSAIQWFYGCKATSAGGQPVDPIVKRYFNNSGITLSC